MRKGYLESLEITCADVANCRIWTMQALYFGAYYRQEENAYRLTVRILNLDSQVRIFECSKSVLEAELIILSFLSMLVR